MYLIIALIIASFSACINYFTLYVNIYLYLETVKKSNGYFFLMYNSVHANTLDLIYLILFIF